MKTNKLKVFLGSVVIFLFQSCGAIDEPFSDDMERNEDVLSHFFDAGFEMGNIGDGVPIMEFNTDKEALEFLKEWNEEHRIESDSINIMASKSSIRHIQLKYDKLGAITRYYFTYENISVDFRTDSNISNENKIMREGVRVDVKGQSIPFADQEMSADFRLDHSGGYNYIDINFKKRVTFAYKGQIIYQYVDLVNYLCAIDFERLRVGIVITEK